MNCHGPVKNQWRCDIFPFVRVCLLVLWLSTWSPLLAACGRVRGKKRWFPTGGCFPVAAEMCCASRGPEWRFSLDCWPPPQIFAERGGGFVPFASSQGHNLQHMAGSQRYQGLWLDWKRNCLNASVFIIAAVKYVKPQESKSKNGDTGSCPSLGTGHANVQGKVQEQSKHIWNLPAPHTVPPTSRHLQLRALPLQAVTGLPRKDKAEVVSPADLVLWLAPHFCYVQRTQSCLSHPCRGSPGFGPSLFSTQKPSWLQKTSPEGFKVLSNYWIL